MTKKILMGLLMVILASCTKKEKMFSDQIISLKKKNDSLTSLLNEINDKYVFDSISFREIPSSKNTFKLGSVYEVELVVVGYSPNRNHFIKYDTIINEKKINIDTLKERNGGYKLKVDLNKKKNRVRIDMNIDNKFGKSKKGALHDLIKVKE